METLAKAVLGFILACSLPAAAHAQAAVPSGAGALDPLVREIRLLRQVLERQGAATARAQLLIARLTLQDQRATRARQEVEQLQVELASAERERDDLRSVARETARALEQLTDESQRPQLESGARRIRERTVAAEAQRSRTEARLEQARQALDSEAGRYEELERALAELDRQLQAAP